MPNRKMSTISNRKSIEDIIALTPLQSGMLFHYLKESQSALYHELLFLELSGPLDRELFEKAWHHVTGTNEMLRTVFRWEGLETPVQLILKEFKPVPEYYRLPGATVTPGQDSDTKYRLATSVEEIKQKELEKGFLLSDVPFKVTLCKIEEEKYGLFICNHHILYDGWSNGIILKEFFEAYNILSAGNLLPKKIKSRFKEFVKWIQRRDLN
ncbi:MAG: hypothetical protein GY757_59225, partial [bacterium]|nr:hypothetical protein [bacterium]